MLSIEQCKKYLGSIELKDEEIQSIRDELYIICETTLDKHFLCGIVVDCQDHEDK